MNSGTMAFCAPTAAGAGASSLLFGAWHNNKNNRVSVVRQDDNGDCYYPSVVLWANHPPRPRRRTILTRLGSSEDDASNTEENSPFSDDSNDAVDDITEEQDFLKKELSRINSLEETLAELEQHDDLNGQQQLEQQEEDSLDKEALLELFGSLPEEADPVELAEMERIPGHENLLVVEEEQLLLQDNDDDTLDQDDQETNEKLDYDQQQQPSTTFSSNKKQKVPIDPLENALLQGVVPADAGVGSESLPGDFGFDPLDLASKDYIGNIQNFVRNLIPGDGDDKEEPAKKTKEPRPKALILRDYREAEIRHGRLAMLAAIIWPVQEMLDRLFLDEDQFGSTTIVYGGVTLPYLPLLMTAIMLLLGYLDIYATAIKDLDSIGEAFLPGDCFWDPLSMLQDAPPSMKRNMQEREIFNGRTAMLGVACYIFEEATTHQPLITIPGNELLFEPVYQIPYIQEWLDSIFAAPSPITTFPEV